ncbi:MAG TPA: D-aminoacylase [Rhodanobacteraceae bacterium]|jgi:dihydroorotase/N-acyl-D-amino-acid deacylase|nr:D-aminoacylase [Rhodanobacteraceae bacterium]
MSGHNGLVLAVSAILFAGVSACSAADSGYDVIIRNGHIVDGTGSPWYAADVAVKDGHIAAIGGLANAKAARTIDARGMVVAPGFIDMLGQSELTLLVDPRAPSKIYQGITTEITGEGQSAAPLNDAMIKENQPGYDHYQLKADWRTLAQYFARLEKQGIGINMGTYIGAASVRAMVIGYGNRAPTPDELKQMETLVDRGMKDGALGLSTALQYPPAPYASTEELIALAKVASRHGGIYATHMRSEGNAEDAALDETFRIGREADIGVEIFHLKTSGQENWGKMPHVIERIDKARAEGIDVAADTYAYTAWNNDMAAFTPPWANDGGSEKLVERLKDPAMRARMRKDMTTPTTDWDNEWLAIKGPQDILICSVNNPELVKYQGKRVSEIAAEWNSDAIDTIFDFLIKDKAGTYVTVFGMDEPDVALALQQPWMSVDNDASGASPEGLLGKDHPHPRAYGTFPRILAKYVRDERKLSLPDAIRKFTSLPAQREHLADRGVIKQGMWADLVVFDPAKVRDEATYADPNKFSVGMQHVIVNGVAVIEDGKMTGKLPGKVLRGAGYAAH